MGRALRIAAGLIWLFALASRAEAAPHIVWRLDNPFRLFDDAQLTDVHRIIYEGLQPAERLAPIVSAERRLQSIFPGGWARPAYRKTCWRASENRYSGCEDGDAFAHPTSHRIRVGLAGIDPGSAACEWTVSSRGSRDQVVIATRTGACRDQVLVDIPYPEGAEVSVRIAGQYAAETYVTVEDVFIVGIGDSFASGEGNPDKPVSLADDRDVTYGAAPGGVPLTGYPARGGTWAALGDDDFLKNGPEWWSQACHRSLYSHQVRVALQLAIENPHRAVTFVSFACAGAEATFGLLLRYKGTEWAPDQPDRPQVSQVARAQCGNQPVIEEKYPTAFSLAGQLPELNDITIAKCPRDKARPIDILLVSVGGNDVGFASLVANAVLQDKGLLRKLGGWMGTVFGSDEALRAMPELAKRYKALNRAFHGNLHIPWNESDRIILTAYPVMSLLDDGRSVCASGGLGMDVFPEFDLDEKKAADGELAGEELYSVMKSAARTYYWSFVEAHRADFAGHGVCAGGSGPDDEMRLPRRMAGEWAPYAPSLYRPYAPRRRWFRTPNDAFLTGNFHIGSAVLSSFLQMDSAAWFQVVLASTYSGAFHPTAEGQAVIADAVLNRARKVLDKYSRKMPVKTP
ncbi:MAG: hypothetical protein R3D33_06420 [Hyphomicrobiaceae bacterium]